jgi:hypothetical protein
MARGAERSLGRARVWPRVIDPRTFGSRCGCTVPPPVRDSEALHRMFDRPQHQCIRWDAQRFHSRRVDGVEQCGSLRSAGRGVSRSGSLSVSTTHALFARKVQRKESNGVAGLAAAASSLDRQKSRRFLLSQRSTNARKDPCWHPGIRPELRFPRRAAQPRIVSVARIRLDSRKSVRPFKGIFCADISELVSHAQPRSRSLGIAVVSAGRRKLASVVGRPDLMLQRWRQITQVAIAVAHGRS